MKVKLFRKGRLAGLVQNNFHQSYQQSESFDWSSLELSPMHP